MTCPVCGRSDLISDLWMRFEGEPLCPPCGWWVFGIIANYNGKLLRKAVQS